MAGRPVPRLEERGVVEWTEGEAMGLRYDWYVWSYDQGGEDWDWRGSDAERQSEGKKGGEETYRKRKKVSKGQAGGPNVLSYTKIISKHSQNKTADPEDPSFMMLWRRFIEVSVWRIMQHPP